jgi:hypothetical protein
MELQKREKKLAREIIEKGLLQEFQNGLEKSDKIIGQWKNNPSNPREASYTLYKHIITFDKHIARRYDDMRGSTYLYIIAGQLADNVITEQDIEGFSEEVQETIRIWARG